MAEESSMKKEILYAGLDVDDQAYHFFGYSKESGALVQDILFKKKRI